MSILKEALDARANGTTVYCAPAVRMADLLRDAIGTISEAGVIRLASSGLDDARQAETLRHLQRIRDDEYTDSQVTARCIAHHLAQEAARQTVLPKKVKKKSRQPPALLKDQYGGYT